jgi:hypothetical protein
MLKRLSVAVVLSVSMLMGCGGVNSLPKDPKALGVKTADLVKLGFSATSQSVQTLATVHAVWMEELVKLGDRDLGERALPIAREVSAAIEKANSCLLKAAPYVQTGKNAAEVKSQLLEAVRFAKLAAEGLSAMGRPVPDKALEGLDYIDAVLGGGK